MLRYVPLILKNCWRNRRRTTLTILSIGVSMCLLGVLMAVYYAFYYAEPAPEQARRLITRNRVSLTFAFPLYYRERILQIGRPLGLQEIMAMQWYNGTYKDARDPKNFFARFAVEPEKLFKIYGEMQLPEEQKLAFQHDRTGCVIGRDLANKFGFKLGDRINITGDIFPGTLELTVRAIFDSPRQSEVLYFDRKYLEEGLPERRKGQVGTLVMLVDTPEHVTAVAQAIDNEFRNSPAQTKTETEQAFTLGFLSLLGDVKMILLSICGAVMFTILLVSANTMAMSVRERTREVGVLKTLGFTPGGILAIILGEACSIAVAGGAFGFALSVMLTGAVKHSPAGGFLPNLRPFEPAVAAACILTALAIGAASSLVPALGAARISIVEALRSTD